MKPVPPQATPPRGLHRRPTKQLRNQRRVHKVRLVKKHRQKFPDLPLVQVILHFLREAPAHLERQEGLAPSRRRLHTVGPSLRLETKTILIPEAEEHLQTRILILSIQDLFSAASTAAVAQPTYHPLIPPPRYYHDQTAAVI